MLRNIILKKFMVKNRRMDKKGEVTTGQRQIAWRVCLAGCLVLCLTGCIDPPVQTAAVSGRITLDGQPLAGAKVIFIPERFQIGGQRVPYSYALTDENGRYKLTTVDGKLGAAVGRNLVFITTRNEPVAKQVGGDNSESQRANDEKAETEKQPDGLEAEESSSKSEENNRGDAGEQTARREEVVPFRYNIESEITFDVVRGTGNQANFDL